MLSFSIVLLELHKCSRTVRSKTVEEIVELVGCDLAK
jgi:hypothetical protein